MSTTELGVRRSEGYVYNSLHQGFPMLPAVAVFSALDGPATPAGWLLGWAVLLLAAGWAGLTVLHTRLRDLELMPPSGWDRLFRTRHRRGFQALWVALGLASAGTAGLFAPSEAALLGISTALLAGILALPVLLIGVESIDGFPATRMRTGVAMAVAVGLSLLALWAVPTRDVETLQLRFGTSIWAAIFAAFLVSFGSMFVNVIATTRALERARADEARLAVAEERVRFARDLHDVFGRTLSAVALTSELAAAQAELGRPEAAATMREVQSIATDALAEVRQVVRGYREADLATEVAGAKALLEAAGIEVTAVHEGSTPLPAPVARAFAWTVREAVTNVLRHADASAVRIAVETGAERARLEVANDRPHLPTGAAGSGLTGLAERLAEVGGHLTWDRRPDAFTLTATVDAAALEGLRRLMREENP